MLTTEVLRTLSRHDMLVKGERVLVALSGGPDSTALLRVLSEEKARLGISLIAAHVDHQLRDDSGADTEFCARLCARLGVPFLSCSADVRARARRERRSVEEAGRHARYELLADLAARHDCARIAVGHTADDQAETLVMRLARGSGSRGLAAVYPIVRESVRRSDGGPVHRIRPLLASRRAGILRYLEERGQDYLEDPSNLDSRFTRNRLRHDLLPRMSRALNPRLTETLAATAELLRDDEDFLDGRAREAFETLGRVTEGEVELDEASLRDAHPALQRRILRIAYERLHGDVRGLSKRHVAALLSLLGEARSGREVHLPRCVARRSFGRVTLARRGSTPPGVPTGAPRNGYNEYEYRFEIPSRTPVRELGGWLSANPASPGLVVKNWRASGTAVVVGIEAALTELQLRSPEPTDRFRPLGAPGSKPLRRYLMERRVAREERCHVPLVARADSREILWVVGHDVSESARVRDGRRAVTLEWGRA